MAKSPYEPVTLSVDLPGSRDEGQPRSEDISPEAVVTIESLGSSLVEHKQSTRAAQSVEQERDTKGTSESTDSEQDSTGSTQSVESNSTAPTEGTTETEGSSTVNESDTEATTSSKQEPFVTTENSLPSESTTASTTTTTTTTATSTTTTDAQPTRLAEAADSAPTTTLAPVEATSPASAATTSSTEETDKAISTEASAENESSTKDQPEASSTANEKEETTTPAATPTPAPTSTSTTTTSFTVTEIPQTTSRPASSTSSGVEVTSEEPTSSPAPTSTTTEQVPPAPNKTEEAKVDDIVRVTNCNHLPTYDSEEIQKVFREETTYKNGTIKGKFTYINFDQRYRLVHYTRLPYGPVKIDQVEELGKPESNGTSSGGSTSNETPNSVLQLRNILPNSLFGFPFLGPSNANKPIEPKESVPVAANNNNIENSDNDRSNMYFYSTDSISTPNLLSPSVPVSLLPGQRKLSHQRPNTNADTLSQSFYEDLPVGNVQTPTLTAARQFKLQIPGGQSPSIARSESHPHTLLGHSDQNQLQFQYALASQAGPQEPPKRAGMVYTYSAQAQPHYQYSPLPVYPFQQSSYFSTPHQPLPQIPSYSGSKSIQELDQQRETSPFSVQNEAHQPHGHEHYVAPFMFAQPKTAQHSNRDNLTEPPKPKLKLKTPKTLNLRQDATSSKSAQLRASYSAPINSPAHVHRLQHRQRAGKQNNELKPAYNSSPIVYHVLRSPLGRMYTLPQYQSHSIAYDHDDK